MRSVVAFDGATRFPGTPSGQRGRTVSAAEAVAAKVRMPARNSFMGLFREGDLRDGGVCLIRLAVGRGFDSRHRILDGLFFLFICSKIGLWFEKTEDK